MLECGGDAGLDSRPFSMPLTAASPTFLFTDSMVSLTAEVESFCANRLVEKRMRVVVAMGARGARIAIVLRRDMSFVGFWSVCRCCLDRWGCNSSSCLMGAEMLTGGDLHAGFIKLALGRRHFGVTPCCLVRVALANVLVGGFNVCVRMLRSGTI